MMKFSSILAIFAFAILALPAEAQTLFQSQDAAQARCPNDTVVWLNTRSGVYHFQGERWYGNTEHGAYVCEKEADVAGDRATKNGQ
jgi:hypothetical protein